MTATAIYDGEKASLAVRSFAPNDAKLSVENGRIPYHVLSARTPAETPAQPAYLRFKNGRTRRAETQFLTAIVPAKNESAAQGLISRMTEVVGDNLKGIRVERGERNGFGDVSQPALTHKGFVMASGWRKLQVW